MRKEIDLFFIKFKVLKCNARAFCGTGGFNFIFLVQKTYCKKNKILIDFFEVDRFRQVGLGTLYIYPPSNSSDWHFQFPIENDYNDLYPENYRIQT